MTVLDIAHQRLINQHLVEPSFEQAQEVVRWLGAVQAQDYPGAKWGIAQRTRSLTNADIDSAFAQGTILRTHVMRPTWHFVTPEDIRWMLSLTVPRVNAANALYYRRLELDDAVFSRSNAVLAKSLARRQPAHPLGASVSASTSWCRARLQTIDFDWHTSSCGQSWMG